MGQFDALLKPLRIKGTTIRNRVMSTAHAAGYMEHGEPGERYRLYQAEKAKGGIGLTICGGASAVSLDMPATVFNSISLRDDSVIPSLAQLTEAIHRHGATTFCQITHMGRRARWDTEHWFATIAPSPVREPMHRSFPKEMEDWDIRRVRRDYAEAVRRVRDGGFDGCELSNAHLHVIDQFWSPSVNRRTDAYGGSLANRMRFGLEVFEAIRSVVGPDFVVGMRMSGDELLEGGLGPEECLEIARTYATSGMVDFISVVGGQATTYARNINMIPNMAYPPAPFLHVASAIKQVVGVPVFHAQRIADLATAARAVEDGHVDMVAMTRAHMADPHIVRKLAEGRADDIRPCVGAAYCADQIFAGSSAVCIHNAATGREETMPHIVRRTHGRRRIVVVGGGPGGLEAARVSAERGHEVILFESSDRLGGQIAVATKLAWREQLSGIARWLEHRVRALGVDIRLRTVATAADVSAAAPDAVVIATGGRPNKGNFEGADLAISTWDVFANRVAVGEKILVHDDHGQHQGAGAAQILASNGALVELVTPDRTIAEEAGLMNVPTHLRELFKLNVVMTPCYRLHTVYREGNKLVAVLRNEYCDMEEERIVDQVVAEHGTLPEDDLYFALKPQSRNLGEVDLEAIVAGRPQAVINNLDGTYELYRVGDAVASRNIHAAIYDSLRLCKNF